MKTNHTGILIILGILLILAIPVFVMALRAWWDTTTTF